MLPLISSIILAVAFAFFLIRGPGFEIYGLFGLVFLFFITFLFWTHIFKKNKSYVPIILLSLLLLSPLLPTRLNIKGYTRLNEIFLIVAIVLTFMTNALRGKSVRLRIIGILFFFIGFSASISILFGYFFLDVIPTVRDFYQVFNIMLFYFYFKFGTFFDYKNKQIHVMLGFIFFTILALNIISICQLFPWGFENIVPLYVPKSSLEGYQIYYAFTGSLGRIIGIIASPTSFSIILIIIIIMIEGWILYMQVTNKKHDLFLKLLLISTIAVLILTFSRTGLVALIISQAYLLTKAKGRDKKNISRITKVYVLVFTLAIAYLACFGGSHYLKGFRLHNIFFDTKDEYSYGRSDLNTRFVQWGSGIKKGMMSPIFGWGPANASNIEAEWTGKAETERGFYGPHNEYIDIFIQTGLVGLTLFLLFFISVFKKASMILLNNNSDNFSIYMARSVKAIIVALAVFGFSDGFWFNPITPSILMLIFGAMYVADRNSRTFSDGNIKINQLRTSG